jgi:hypothetical protein
MAVFLLKSIKNMLKKETLYDKVSMVYACVSSAWNTGIFKAGNRICINCIYVVPHSALQTTYCYRGEIV